jgi:hypothetical protein
MYVVYYWFLGWNLYDYEIYLFIFIISAVENQIYGWNIESCLKDIWNKEDLKVNENIYKHNPCYFIYKSLMQ